jgi:hypothetical protein
VYFTLIHSTPSITLPYPFTFYSPFFSSFQYTSLNPLPSHLMLYTITDAQSSSFAFPLSSSSIEYFHCYKHVLHLSLCMVMLVFVYMFIFGSIFHIWEKTRGFCFSNPGLLHLTCGEHHLKGSYPGSEGQRLHVFSHMWHTDPIQIQAMLWKTGHTKGRSLMGEEV